MHNYLWKVAVGLALVGGLPLRGGILWDGLLTPSSLSEAGLSVGPQTFVGFRLLPQEDARLGSLFGFIGRPNDPIVWPHLPPSPKFTVSLWTAQGLVGDPRQVQLSILGLQQPTIGTESGLRVWSVFCDLSDVHWVLTAGIEYILAVSMDLPGEWLIHNPVHQPSLWYTGSDWQTLPGVLGWNARLHVTPVPEPVGTGVVLAGFAALLAVGRRAWYQRR